MKATKAGRIIGIALQAFNPTSTTSTNDVASTTDDQYKLGSVVTFINPTWQGNDLSVQETIGQTSTSTITLIDSSSLKQALVDLGLEVLEDGTLRVEKLQAERVETNTIRMNKMEMVDQTSGEVWCTWIENGEWIKEIGECGSQDTSVSEPSPASNVSSGGSAPVVPDPEPSSSPSLIPPITPSPTTTTVAPSLKTR